MSSNTHQAPSSGEVCRRLNQMLKSFFKKFRMDRVATNQVQIEAVKVQVKVKELSKKPEEPKENRAKASLFFHEALRLGDMRTHK